MRGYRERGSVLLAVVLALSLVVSVALLLNRGSGMNLGSSARQEMVDVARAAAEAGLNHAIWQVRKSNCIGYTDIPYTPFGSTLYQNSFGAGYTATVNPKSGSPVTITVTGTTADGTSRTLTRADVDCGGPLEPVACEADYTPDIEVQQFSTTPYAEDKAISLTYLPEGMVFNGETSPAGGAWVILNSINKMLYMTDMGGNLLTSATLPINAAWGITLVTSGPFADHLTITDNGLDDIIYVPLDFGTTTSVSTSDFGVLNPQGIGFIAETSSGIYDERLALIDKADATIYIVTQLGVVETSFPAGGPTVPTIVDVKHLPGTDKLLVSYINLARIYDMNGTVLREYDMSVFNGTNVKSVVIHPPSCQHVMLDSGLQAAKYLASSSSISLSSLILNPVADAGMESGNPNDNFGDASEVGVNSSMWQGTVQFDVAAVPAGALVDSATLRIYISNNKIGSPAMLEVFALLESWVEAEITWNNRTSVNSWTVGGGDYWLPAVTSATIAKGEYFFWLDLDLTALVQEWVDGFSDNNGVVLIHDQPKDIKFHSRENANQPQLVIIYTPL